MPPFFFIHWMKMIKSQPSKMKKKKKNFKKNSPGYLPLPFSPPFGILFPFFPPNLLSCSLPLHLTHPP